jgi:hypothetical protein
MPRARMRAHMRGHMRIRILGVAVAFGCLVAGSAAAHAQNSFDLAIHAGSGVTPGDIGLPAYPGATPARSNGSDDKAEFDIGFAFGDTHFRMKGISYDSDESPDRILEFYRKALGRYGDVLECDHGRPVGALTVTSSGLKCSDQNRGDHVSVDGRLDSSKDHELRAGSPDEFRIVGINASHIESARFVIMYVKTPKDTDTK